MKLSRSWGTLFALVVCWCTCGEKNFYSNAETLSEETPVEANESENRFIEISLNGNKYLVMTEDLEHTLIWADAIDVCNNSTVQGYTGWYLPSKSELYSLYKRKGEIGGFADLWYWSSTETSASTALQQDFGNGKQNAHAGKDDEARVRCIREK